MLKIKHILKNIKSKRLSKPIFLLLLVICFFILFYITIKSFERESFESYDNCVNQGYPQNFCLHVPIQASENDDDAYKNDVTSVKLKNPVPPKYAQIRHWCRPGEWCKPKWIKNIYDQR
jgi:hypothetical protein